MSKLNKRQKKNWKKIQKYIQPDGYFRISAEEVTLMHKPIYNGHAIKCGVHGDTKYNRRKEKRAFQKALATEW